MVMRPLVCQSGIFTLASTTARVGVVVFWMRTAVSLGNSDDIQRTPATVATTQRRSTQFWCCRLWYWHRWVLPTHCWVSVCNWWMSGAWCRPPYHSFLMQFQVDDIELDFEMEDDVYPPEQTQHIVTEGCIGMWEADDEEDLIEEITNATGWCVKSIDYRHVLKWLPKHNSLSFCIKLANRIMVS